MAIIDRIDIGGSLFEIKDISAGTFITREVSDLLYYYTKDNTFTKDEVRALIAQIQGMRSIPVQVLPTASAQTIGDIYLVPSSDPQARNLYDEYITVENSGSYSWEKFGSASIDMDGYVTEEDLTAALADKVDKETGKGLSENDYTDEDKALVGTIEGKQDTIQDLDEIRSGAALGATAYQKPSSGIPGIDLARLRLTGLPLAGEYTAENFRALYCTLEELAKAANGTYQTASYEGMSGTSSGFTMILPLAGGVNAVFGTLSYTVHIYNATTVITVSWQNTGNTVTVTTASIPDVSQFVTRSVNDLANYYLKSETFTKAEVQSLIGAIQQFHYEIYASTSAVTSPASNVLYLIGPTGTGADKYEEYVYDATKQNPWVKIGDTSIDLSGYVTTSALNAALADYTTTANLTTLLAGKQDKIDSTHKLDYSLVDNTPTIPDAVEANPTVPVGTTPTDLQNLKVGSNYFGLSGKENTSNKVTSLSAQSTDTQYPSAKAVVDYVDEHGGGNIDTVNVSVDNTSGTPSGSGSVSGSTLNLSFSGLKGQTGPVGPQGPQGNSGYTGAAGELEVVNNLTTNDATKALSAAQGKRLGDDITLTNIDVKGEHISRSFTGSTSWNEGIPLPAGLTYNIKLSAVGSTPGVIYLNRYTGGTRGSSIQGNIPFDAELTYEVPAGDDGIYILVVSASGDRTYTMDAVAVDSTKKNIDGLLADVADLDERTDELEETTAGFSEDKYYSRATPGVYFGDNEVGQLLASAMKAAWIEIYDQQNMPPEVVNLTFLQNNSSGCNIAFGATGEARVFVYSSGTKLSGIQTINLGYSSLGVYYARLYMIIDFDILDNVRYYNLYKPLGPYINTRELNGWEKITITMRDKCTDLQGHLFGKSVVVFGDSLSEFTGTDGLQWTTHLERFTGCTAINVGIGGAEFGQRAYPSLTPANADQAYAGLDIVSMVYAACGVDFDGEHDYMDVVEASEAWIEAHPETRDNNAAIIARFKAIDWSNVDAVILFAGANDWNNSPNSFGEMGSYDPRTTTGGINEIIRCLCTTYKSLRIYFVSTVVKWLDYDIDPTDVSKFSDYVVKGGRTLPQWVAAMKEVVVNRHIEFCDLYNTLGWNEYNFSEFFPVGDGSHPRKGFAEIARKIATFISNT